MCKRHTQEEVSLVKAEAENGDTLSQAKECLGLSEGRGKEGACLEALGGAWPCQHRFQTSSLHTSSL